MIDDIVDTRELDYKEENIMKQSALPDWDLEVKKLKELELKDIETADIKKNVKKSC